MRTKLNLYMYLVFMKLITPFKRLIAMLQLGQQNAFDIVNQRSIDSSADYIISNLEGALLFPRKKELWAFSLRASLPEGLSLEFGVYDGQSIRVMANMCPERKFNGFDSFVGLQEDWTGNQFLKGSFSRKGKIPSVPRNVTLHKGWFNDSLPDFLKVNKEDVCFIHFDADTYESTIDVLMMLKSRLQSGTVLVFDEYFGYPNWENGEFKAWKAFTKTNKIEYRYLGFSTGQSSVQITKLPK